MMQNYISNFALQQEKTRYPGFFLVSKLLKLHINRVIRRC